MLTCNYCRSALLDRQYGLLDAAEAAAVDAHVAACPECQAEQLRVERFGKLLTAAARSEFPDVRFVAPSEVSFRREAQPSVSGNARLRLAAKRYAAWAVAAAILLAVGIPAGMNLTAASRQRTELAAAVQTKENLEGQRRDATARHVAELTQAQADLQKAQATFRSAESTLATKYAEAQRDLQQKQLNFTISGPATYQPGAPAEYLVQTRDPAGRPVPATVSYRVKDEAGKEVTDVTRLLTQGDIAVKLPPTVPLKPNSNLYLEVAAERADGTKAAVRERLKLAAPVYVTHLATDKPMYQPGEVIRFRSLTLDRATLKPAEEPLAVQFVVRDALGAETQIAAGNTLLAQADGKPVLGPAGKPVTGIAVGDWTIPSTARGGEYTLVVKETNGRFPEERRRFLVNQYQAARLNMVLEWSRKSFGPGAEVIANCKVSNASGPVANKPAMFQATVDGQQIAGGPCGTTGADGSLAVRFTLRKEIEKGEGSLTVIFTDGGNRDSLVKPIPIALKKLAVEFYAEGGQLVAGVPNRVYFQARTTLGKPADLKGRIIDDKNRVVTAAETLTDDAEPGINQGMGRFEFTPENGRAYRLQIDEPVGTEGEYKLPAVTSDGVVLTVLSEVSGDPDPIRVRVASVKSERTLLVGAYARGRLLDHRRVTVEANKTAEVELKPAAGVGGVTRITVFEEVSGEPGALATGGMPKQLLPRAERLVYRKPAGGLKLTAEPDKNRYVPGERVTLSLRAGEPGASATGVPAIAMVGVVNKSVVTMADEKTFRTMPTSFLLTSEIRRPEDLEHADVLLGSHPKAAAALDLLLGTQGWRRFAEQPNAPPPLAQDADDRILLAQANSPRIQANSYLLAARKVQETYGPPFTKANDDLVAANERVNRSLADAQYSVDQKRIDDEIKEARAAAQATQAQLWATLETRERTLRWALPAVCGVALLVALATFITGFWFGFRRYVAAAASLGVATVAAAGIVLNMAGEGQPDMRAAARDRLDGVVADAPIKMLTEESVARARFEAEGAQRAYADFRLKSPVQFFKNAPGDQPALDRLEELEVGKMRFGGGVAPPAAAMPEALGALKAGDAFARDKVDGEKMEGKNVAQGRNAAPLEDVRKLRGGQLADDAKKKDAKDQGGAEPANRAVRLQHNNKPAEQPAPAAAMPPGGVGGFAGLGGGGRGQPIAGPQVPGLVPADRVGGRMNRRLAPRPQPFIVREYAHKHTPAPGGDRTDFAETVYWQPVLVLPADGAKVSFDLSDEVTHYQVLVAVHTLDGRLGALETKIEARKPFSLEPKLPVEITAGDRIDVPVTLANDTDASRSVTVLARPTGFKLTRGNLEDKVTLAPNQSARRIFSFQPSFIEGIAELRLIGRCEPFGDDAVVRTVPVVPEGFPVIGTVSDVIDGVARHEVVLPQTWVPGTLKCQVSAYPSTLAELQKGLEGLLREPGGCFEQTSTTNYPNALILQYLKESDQANPAAMKHAKDLLDRGYAKLIAFEVPEANKRQGFEWFGSFPAHEALTAYGLMQFRDMAKVSDVDPQLLRRTREYLLSRRDGKGGFTRNPLALDTFGRAPADITTAYIIWALTDGGNEDDVSKELNILAEKAKTSEDPYFLALVANCLLNRDRGEEAATILKKLAGKLTKDGFLDGAKTSITGSSGRTLEIESTALAVLGWLKSNRAEFTPAVRSAVGWIGKQRGGYGGFGSTQSTILALKALIAYTKANKKTPEAGELAIGVGDRVISKISFAAGTQDALTVALPDAERQLKPGKNDVRVIMTGKNNFPYTLTWSYQTLQPPSAEGCAVKLTTALDKAEVAEGETTHLNVKVENVSHKGQGMAVAIVGLPAGLKLPDDFAQLKDLARPRDNGTKAGRIGAFEVRGRELVLYWRDLAPDAVVDLSLDLRALVPGVYHGPASRAYLYYNPDVKYWTMPLAATIAAKE